MPIKPYVQEINYDHYRIALAAITKDEPEEAMYLPPEFKTFMRELKSLMTTIALDGVPMDDIAAALKDRDLFVLLQAAGWSLKKVSSKLKSILLQRYA